MHLGLGYEDQIGPFSVSGVNCHALTRIDPTGSHWQYQIICEINGEMKENGECDPSSWIHLNFDFPIGEAPGTQVFEELLLRHGVLETTSATAGQRVVEIKGLKKYPPFPCYKLQLLATYEIMIFGLIDLDLTTIYCFDLPDGKNNNDFDEPDDSDDSDDENLNKEYSECRSKIDEALLGLGWNAKIKFQLANWSFNINAIEQAIKDGVNIDEPIYQAGNTAMFIAISCDSSEGNEMVKLFLENGANPQLKNAAGETPLHAAVMFSNLEMCSLFCNPASILISNNKGETPLDLSRKPDAEKEIEPCLMSSISKLAAQAAINEFK